ncbi:SUN domain-containing protein 1 isoform X2 [Heteronotia binoei]|uniref:SUN domain-containing protein 1 isoform X2 n=1 Tax=Heteronotia binoei TaxID=13085 RepID=UPI00292EDE9F|nr:SUN domain-containing protein 1 isoform X2 [Heteronotia binoei]
MDFSHLHTYSPPQYVPENTGYTYSLSSSYSSTALDFEARHKLDPVFDSPRMSRRSLRLSATAYSTTEDGHGDCNLGSHSSSCAGKKTFEEQLPRITRHRKNMVKQSGPVRQSPRKTASSTSVFSQSSFSSRASDASFMSTVLDESSIKEQTAVKHFWGLDDDGDLKGGHTTVIQANGDVATAESQMALSNGYTGNDCSILSERKEVLTAFSTAHMPPTRIYSRDRSQKHKSGGLTFYTSKILEAAKYSATSVTSLLVQLFHVVLLKLGYDSKAYSSYYGSTNVKEILREDHQLGTNGEYFCDDCKGKKQLEGHTAAYMPSSHSKGVARTIWHIFSYAGYFLLHTLQRAGTAGWLASKKVLSLLWLAVVSPGKAASGVFWWLGTGWYQLVTLISLLNVFILTRCLPMLFRMFLYLLPLLLLLGLWFWGSEGFVSLLPALNWSMVQKAHWWDDSGQVSEPLLDLPHTIQPADEPTKSFDSSRMIELEKQVAFLSNKWHHLDKEYSQILLHLQAFQGQIAQLNDKSETLAVLKDTVDQHLKEPKPMPDFSSMHEDHEQRIVALEDLLGRLSEKSDWLSSHFASKSSVQVLLRDVERRIIRRLSCHMTETNTRPSPELVRSIASQAGVSGITEEQAHTIVNNALKLYSEDKTGLADFALESGGGSVLSTRCSETYNTQTAVISLFGVPLWYFSQSPRTVIQPEIYPGNCWAFRGSQGHLVIRLSMTIHPTAFTLEHISKSLSPRGNIDSAPKDFAVYGLDDEYQEEGVLLGQYTYDQDGKSLQIFQATDAVDKAYQIVELKILSNWGNAEYTCLYRFRVHGRLAQ